MASTSSVFSRALARTAAGSLPNEDDRSWSKRRIPRPVPGSGAQHLVAVAGLEPVLAVAEEREVVGGQPAQQVLALGDLGAAQRRRVGVELLDDRAHLLVHLRPVLDGHADVAEHPLQRLLDLGRGLAVADPGDLDVHPGLADGVALGGHRAVLDAGDRLELAGDVADDVHLRVDHEADVEVLARPAPW